MKILLTMMALLLAGPVAAPAQMESTQVEIRAHGFSAPALTVKAGTTVTWINHDDDAHTVTSTANAFRSPGLDTDETFSFTFTQPGTYEYFCTLHPLMTGKVVVTPERSGT
ncbi:MAG TPA: cupredoxin family copper-binding protein [Methylomirabilota bacterium]|jgi:amicyanin|nr:cupredoxin family copper-binding protein [Methylomirabilota bacterium]HWP75506.1 cupredoxin family copper-binding protein [Methylomirabilota bacterium]